MYLKLRCPKHPSSLLLVDGDSLWCRKGDHNLENSLFNRLVNSGIYYGRKKLQSELQDLINVREN